MPYAIEKRGDEFAVVTKGTGKVHGRFPSKSAADGQLRALYANAPPEGEQRKAAGGEVSFRVHTEEPEHFLATGRDGKNFRIAKKGLSKRAHERYQRLCRGGEALAEGGEAKPPEPKPEAPKREPVDLSRVRLVKESETHNHLKDHRGPFSVAKKGLSKAMHAKIQAFAEGGDAAPEPSLDPAAATDATPTAEPPTPTPDEAMGAWFAGRDRYEQDLAAQKAADAAAQAAPPPGPGAEDVSGFAPAVLGSGPAPSAPAAAPAASPSAPGAAQPAASPSAAESAPAAAAYSASAEGEPPAPKLPAIPGGTPKAPDTAQAQKDVEAAYEQAQAAEKAKADVATQESARSLEVQQTLEKQRQDLQKTWTDSFTSWQKRGDDLRQQILDQKIDPNHYWNEKGTGGKIRAAIGIILAGAGAGLTHSPNAALQVVEAAIDRDIDAQKANLGKATTLLGFHMQAGNTLMAARQLAVADMKDAAAAQMAMVATKFAGDKAQAMAQSNIAALRRSAVLDRQQVAAQGFDMQYKAAQVAIARAEAARAQAMFPLQYEQAVLGRNMARLQFGALQGLTAGAGGGGPGGPAMGTRIDPRAIPFLPKEYREALVTLPDGSYALAKTPKAAEETQKAIEAAALLRDKMARYGAILERHPHGVSSTLNPEDYAAAQSLHASILTDINGLAGLNRFTETEAGIYSQRVPDITSKQIRAVGHQAKLGELGKEIDDKIWQTNRSWLNLPTRRRTLQ